MIHEKAYIVASELNDPICHSDECQIGSFSSEATIYTQNYKYLIVLMVLTFMQIKHTQ